MLLSQLYVEYPYDHRMKDMVARQLKLEWLQAYILLICSAGGSWEILQYVRRISACNDERCQINIYRLK